MTTRTVFVLEEYGDQWLCEIESYRQAALTVPNPNRFASDERSRSPLINMDSPAAEKTTKRFRFNAIRPSRPQRDSSEPLSPPSMSFGAMDHGVPFMNSSSTSRSKDDNGNGNDDDDNDEDISGDDSKDGYESENEEVTGAPWSPGSPLPGVSFLSQVSTMRSSSSSSSSLMMPSEPVSMNSMSDGLTSIVGGLASRKMMSIDASAFFAESTQARQGSRMDIDNQEE